MRIRTLDYTVGMQENQRAQTQDQTSKTIMKIYNYIFFILIQTLVHESGLESKKCWHKLDDVELSPCTSAKFHVGMQNNQRAQTQNQTNNYEDILILI